MHNVFVYGTLKENREDTHEVNAEMWSVGSFPCVKLQGKSYIPGQILNVTDEELASLDRYEGVPSLYTRQEVMAFDKNTRQNSQKCWIYEWATDTDGLERIDRW